MTMEGRKKHKCSTQNPPPLLSFPFEEMMMMSKPSRFRVADTKDICVFDM
jgi:hypothetical protein